jgi:hypothetical protein
LGGDPQDRRGERREIRLQVILTVVMPGLVPGIHAFVTAKQGVDGRDEPGHDG